MSNNDCLAMDHEVLTETGWKICMNLTYDDKIAVLHDIKKPTEISYEYPDEIIINEHVGPLYTLKGDNIDISVTTNHRMLVSNTENANYEVRPAEKTIFKNVKYLNAKGEIIPKNKKETLTKHVGRVFGVKVPSEFYYVRRNGKEIWTSY